MVTSLRTTDLAPHGRSIREPVRSSRTFARAPSGRRRQAQNAAWPCADASTRRERWSEDANARNWDLPERVSAPKGLDTFSCLDSCGLHCLQSRDMSGDDSGTHPYPPDQIRERALKEARKVVDDFISHQIDEVLAEVATANVIDVSELEGFYVSLKSESDRGLAIVLLAYVDDVFRSAYSKVLNPAVDGGLDSLLGLAGPLGSAGLRIHMAFALKWIQGETYRSLRTMQKIRNAFAHRVPVSRFEDPGIRSLVEGMTSFEQNLYSPTWPVLKPIDQLTIREKFHVRAMYACSRVIMEMTSAEPAIRRGLGPMAAISRGYDKMAPLHQPAILAAIEAGFKILALESEGPEGSSMNSAETGG
jgi:DNA-binding MltR family transcriptional regulator